jgi:uncharacterized protein YgiM (DUF1202 family)
MKLRRVMLGFVSLMLAATLTFALPVSSAYAAKGKIYRATAGGVRIRLKPQSGSEVIGKLKKGEKVLHVSTKNNWWRIKTASGQTGYVFPSNLKYYKTYDVGQIYRANASKGMKVYSKANTKAKVRGTLSNKYTVVLLAKKNNWGLIRVIKNGRVGYVPLQSLKAA